MERHVMTLLLILVYISYKTSGYSLKNIVQFRPTLQLELFHLCQDVSFLFYCIYASTPPIPLSAWQRQPSESVCQVSFTCKLTRQAHGRRSLDQDKYKVCFPNKGQIINDLGGQGREFDFDIFLVYIVKVILDSTQL